MSVLSRAELLRRGVGSGAVLVASASAFGLASPFAGAATVPDGDLARLRQLIAVELLSLDFQSQALSSGKVTGSLQVTLRQMQADDTAHYTGLAQLATGAGQIPATADDINFAYPNGTFGSSASILKQATTIKTLSLGAYIGSVGDVSTPGVRLPIGQIAANEAQQCSALAQASGRPVIGRAFGPAWSVEAVSNALDVYES